MDWQAVLSLAPTRKRVGFRSIRVIGHVLFNGIEVLLGIVEPLA